MSELESTEKPQVILFKEVKSSNISKIGHFEDKLYVIFKRNGSCYQYQPVSRLDYEKLIGAASIGAHFHNKIVKNKKIRNKPFKNYVEKSH